MFPFSYLNPNETHKWWSFGEGFVRRKLAYWAQTVEMGASFFKDMQALSPAKNFFHGPKRFKKWTDLPHEWTSYIIDTTQRQFLFWDALRKRGNRYMAHIKAGMPPVLEFDYKVLIDGRRLDKPVNYSLVQILPPQNFKIKKNKRPFLIIDPRAGHIAGIGGFKESSQVGVALREGHAVYFTIFSADPVPDQRLGDITQAEILFLKEISHRHPRAPKPCIVGNCQGGWAAMCVAATQPDQVGPVILNGAPLSYWAGQDGKNPMRYLGGLTGGRWLANYLSDLGNGIFDGANLVANFEYLNPTHTLLTKYYHLYARIDTEEERFLKFEHWWGGYSLMNKNEIDTILNELFIGNKLAHGRIIIDNERTLDLRAIREPIFVFCSKGDTISPPHQSLQWIKDIHKDERSIKAAGQVIIYMVHDSIGHLGIFVSGQIAQREYKEIAHGLKTFETLPPGLYEMVITAAKNSDTGYRVFVRERRMRDLLPHFHPENDEQKFMLVKMVSDFNALAYDLFISPRVRRSSNKLSAEFLRQCHYLRWSHYSLSDANPFLALLGPWAYMARTHRMVVEKHNTFVQLERVAARSMRFWLDRYRCRRDHAVECLFHSLYGTLELMNIQPAKPDGLSLLKNLTGTEPVNISGDFYDGLLRILLLLCHEKSVFRRSEINKLTEQVRQFYRHRNITRATMRQKLQAQSIILASEPKSAILKSLPGILKTKDERAQIVRFIETTSLLKHKAVHKLWQKIKRTIK